MRPSNIPCLVAMFIIACAAQSEAEPEASSTTSMVSQDPWEVSAVPFPLTATFHEFSAQCSHNTYIWGQQSGISLDVVDKATLSLALDLGYRCLEIDVYIQGSGPVVKHQVLLDATDSVPLELLLAKTLEWCAEDERAQPATPSAPKFPIVLSIENHVGASGEQELANVLSRSLGDRMVLHGHLPPGTLMRSVAVTSGRRKFILRSKTEGETPSYTSILAIPRGSAVEDVSKAYTSTSQKMSCEEATDVSSSVTDTNLVRTYPCSLAVTSNNYRPAKAFESKANFVCINLQGNCPSSSDVCRRVTRGQRGMNADGCSCERDVSAELELAFMKWGYDGYLHYPSLSSEALKVLSRIGDNSDIADMIGSGVAGSCTGIQFRLYYLCVLMMMSSSWIPSHR